jgi:hypothetical protein
MKVSPVKIDDLDGADTPVIDGTRLGGSSLTSSMARSGTRRLRTASR